MFFILGRKQLEFLDLNKTFHQKESQSQAANCQPPYIFMRQIIIRNLNGRRILLLFVLTGMIYLTMPTFGFGFSGGINAIAFYRFFDYCENIGIIMMLYSYPNNQQLLLMMNW